MFRGDRTGKMIGGGTKARDESMEKEGEGKKKGGWEEGKKEG